jgi:hypothetical protein
MKTAVSLFFGLLLLAAGPARADSLDGNWCSKDGRRMHIEGRTIMTPGGGKMQGDYGRHTFSYIVPANESGAGSFVFLQQWIEEKMKMFIGADEASARQGVGQEWNRCAPATS